MFTIFLDSLLPSVHTDFEHVQYRLLRGRSENLRVRIVIPGGSGQIGRILARYFHAKGETVIVLSRVPGENLWHTMQWDGRTREAWADALEESDVCINLAGRSVNCRYSASNRRAIYDSRVATTRLLNDVIASLSQPPRVWINASTATIYRHALDRNMDEMTGELGGAEPAVPATWNFSIEVAKNWEKAFFATSTPRTRKVAMRSAITFSPDRGGAFDVLLGLVRRGLGGAQGDGDQYVSWIHEADFARAIDFLIHREDISGVVNIASPHPLPNAAFMQALREAWGIKTGLPAPKWLLEIGVFLMRTESELVLKSRRVVPGRLLSAGFEFRFPDWPPAARELVTRWRSQQSVRDMDSISWDHRTRAHSAESRTDGGARSKD